MSFHYDDDRRHSPPQKDEVCDPPVDRDGKGRFRGSGNKKGRPKNAKPQPPASMAEALAKALDEPVTVNVKGKPTTFSMYELAVKKLMHDLLNGTPLDRIRVLRALDKYGALQLLADMKAAQAAEDSGNVWTEELEARYRLIMSEYEDIDDGGEPSEPPE